MTSKNKYLTFMALNSIAMMTSLDTPQIYDDGKKEDNKTSMKTVSGNLAKIPPKGSKEYWFNEEGEFYNGVDRCLAIRKEDVVFHCIAISNKSAIKKFKKYHNDKKTNQTETNKG
jgi:hypothetical protein